MSYYMDIVGDAINIIENNIDRELKLSFISNKLHVSEFHFNRLFTAITGITPKKYIIRRRLTLAATDLLNTKESIIDFAIKWGFNYSEDFSRSFKRYFEMSPVEFRKYPDNNHKKYYFEPIKDISEREFINKNGKIVLKAMFKSLDHINLRGQSAIVSSAGGEHYNTLDEFGMTFLKETASNEDLQQEIFYSLVSCYDNGSDLYNVYFGKKQLREHNHYDETRIIPKGWYACFKYDGKMQQIYDDLEKDLYKWIIQKEIELTNNGVNMVTRYCIHNNYEVSLDEILIPIRDPRL